MDESVYEDLRKKIVAFERRLRQFTKHVIECYDLTSRAACKDTLHGRNVKGMSYNELVAALDPADDIGALLFDERAARDHVFSEVKGGWLEENILKPYLPAELAKRVMVEWEPGRYIDGKDIGGFMEAMNMVYQKVKEKHDAMRGGEDKEDLEIYFLDRFPVAFQLAKDAIAAGFKDRLVAGWA